VTRRPTTGLADTREIAARESFHSRKSKPVTTLKWQKRDSESYFGYRRGLQAACLASGECAVCPSS
jgi:hypothetical protein